jgi:Fe-S-cluster containining protein
MSEIDGYDFKCTQCGDCCKWLGFVYLTDEDIERLARNLTNNDVARFIELFGSRNGPRSGKKKLVLRDREGTNICVFLDDDNKCTINDIKPDQCRKYPTGYDPMCPGFKRTSEVEVMKNPMKEHVSAMMKKLSSSKEYEDKVSSNLYEGLKKDSRSLAVTAKAIEGGVSGFFDDNRVKVASLDDLFGFDRVDNDHLIHKATRDLWKVEADDEGNMHIARLFEAGKPVKG